MSSAEKIIVSGKVDRKLDRRYQKEAKPEKTVVEIQYCINCNFHQEQKHSEFKYLHTYQILKKKLALDNITVKRKLTPQNLYKKSPYSPQNVYFAKEDNQLCYFPAIGSFQVQINNKKVFSKLQSNKWPNIENLIGEIYKAILKNRNQQIGQKTYKQKKISFITNAIMRQNQKSYDVSVYEQSKQKYFRIKQKLNQKILHNRYAKNQQARPNTTQIQRKSLDTKQRYFSKLNQFSSQKFNEQDILEFSPGQLDIQNIVKKKGKSQSSHRAANISQAMDIEKMQFRKRYLHSNAQVYLHPILPKQHFVRDKYRHRVKLTENDSEFNQIMRLKEKNQQPLQKVDDEKSFNIKEIDREEKYEQISNEQIDKIEKRQIQNVKQQTPKDDDKLKEKIQEEDAKISNQQYHFEQNESIEQYQMID